MRYPKVIFYTAIIVNLIYLDFIILTKIPDKTYLISEAENNKAVDQITATPVVLPTITPVPVAKEQTAALPREIYIPVGTGSTKSSSWDGIVGAEVNIDTGKYGYIKEVYFQASLRIPTANGEVYAKLYNETDKHDVWFSEVFSQGEEGTLKEAKISLDPGAKLYRVYLKSTLEAEAQLLFSRIKLIVEE